MKLKNEMSGWILPLTRPISVVSKNFRAGFAVGTRYLTVSHKCQIKKMGVKLNESWFPLIPPLLRG
jgi:hypothetical protein